MANQFRLATFNLENLDYSASRRAVFERRLDVLKPLLGELAADVLCLQEINAQKADHDGRRFLALDRLLAGDPYEGYHRATSVRPGTTAPADVHNLVIASRWPIIERRQLFHDIVAKWSWTPPAEGRPAQGPVEVAWDRPLLYAAHRGSRRRASPHHQFASSRAARGSASRGWDDRRRFEPKLRRRTVPRRPETGGPSARSAAIRGTLVRRGPGRAHRRLRRSQFAGTRRAHANPARRARRGYAARQCPASWFRSPSASTKRAVSPSCMADEKFCSITFSRRRRWRPSAPRSSY